MNWLRLLCLFSAICVAGCGPDVPGPSSEPAPGVESSIDPAFEAEAAAARESGQ